METGVVCWHRFYPDDTKLIFGRKTMQKLIEAVIHVLFLCIVLALGVTAILWIGDACEDPITSRARAQDPALDKGLILARLVVHEAGSHELDHQALHQTLRNAGGGELSFSHGPLRRIRIEEDEGRWPRRLNREMTAPWGWPEARVPWDSDRGVGRWRRVLAWADEMVGAESWPRPCSGTPIAWGGRCEDPRGACDEDRPWHRRVDCGPTLNYYVERAR